MNESLPENQVFSSSRFAPALAPLPHRSRHSQVPTCAVRIAESMYEGSEDQGQGGNISFEDLVMLPTLTEKDSNQQTFFNALLNLAKRRKK